MKLLFALLFLALPFMSPAKPGETYVLTGREKSVFGIFQADLKAYPELYEGVDINAYFRSFKKLNNLDNRKLKIGEELTFPHTPHSQRAADERARAAKQQAEQERKEAAAARANEEAHSAQGGVTTPPPELTEEERQAAEEKARNRARQEGISYFQAGVLPYWVHEQGEILWEQLEQRDTTTLTEQAEQCVDAPFAQAMKLHAYPNRKLYVIEFEAPTRGAACFFAAIKKDSQSGSFSYYTLEKGISLFGAGDASVLCHIDPVEGRVKLGGRDYTDLASFLKEF